MHDGNLYCWPIPLHTLLSRFYCRFTIGAVRQSGTETCRWIFIHQLGVFLTVKHLECSNGIGIVLVALSCVANAGRGILTERLLGMLDGSSPVASRRSKGPKTTIVQHDLPVDRRKPQRTPPLIRIIKLSHPVAAAMLLPFALVHDLPAISALVKLISSTETSVSKTTGDAGSNSNMGSIVVVESQKRLQPWGTTTDQMNDAAAGFLGKDERTVADVDAVGTTLCAKVLGVSGNTTSSAAACAVETAQNDMATGGTAAVALTARGSVESASNADIDRRGAGGGPTASKGKRGGSLRSASGTLIAGSASVSNKTLRGAARENTEEGDGYLSAWRRSHAVSGTSSDQRLMREQDAQLDAKSFCAKFMALYLLTAISGISLSVCIVQVTHYTSALSVMVLGYCEACCGFHDMQ